MIRFDLHLHSTASDGTQTPAELVADCAGRGISAIALTDHDTVDGLDEAARAGERLGVRVIAAMELSTDFTGELHMLGYGMDVRSPALERFLADQRQRRRQRISRIVERLRALDIPITMDEVAREAGDGTAGRPHVARALVSRGICADVDDAFRRFLRRGGPAYAERKLPRPGEAVALIRDAGGRAVLAHPGNMDLSRQALEALTADLKRQGLAGMEAFYPTHSDSFAAEMLRLCQRLGLIPTYGSDCHGPQRGIPPGAGWERFERLIPPETLAFIHSLGTVKE